MRIVLVLLGASRFRSHRDGILFAQNPSEEAESTLIARAGLEKLSLSWRNGATETVPLNTLRGKAYLSLAVRACPSRLILREPKDL